MLYHPSFSSLCRAYVDAALATNVVGSLSTVIGVVTGILVLGDVWGWYTVVGIIITLTGVWLSTRCISGDGAL